MSVGAVEDCCGDAAVMDGAVVEHYKQLESLTAAAQHEHSLKLWWVGRPVLQHV